MKRIPVIITLSLIISLNSCKKDKVEAPPFSAVGYWKGVLLHPAGINIRNYPGGTSRLFIMINTIDTGDVKAVKANGTWKVEDGKFIAIYPKVDLLGEPDLTSVTCEATILAHEPRTLKGVGFIDGPGMTDGTFILNISK